jgi:hypothetical protein
LACRPVVGHSEHSTTVHEKRGWLRRPPPESSRFLVAGLQLQREGLAHSSPALRDAALALDHSMEPYCVLLRAEKIIPVLDVLGLIDSRALPIPSHRHRSAMVSMGGARSWHPPCTGGKIGHGVYERRSITESTMGGRDRPRRPQSKIDHGVHGVRGRPQRHVHVRSLITT